MILSLQLFGGNYVDFISNYWNWTILLHIN